MPRDPRLYLEDIVEACGRIRKYAAEMTLEQFKADRKTVDAVIRNLEVVGEAARSLPASVQRLASEVDWRKISGLRNILIHQYFGIDLAILWDIAESKVHALETGCSRLLAAFSEEESSHQSS